MLWVVGELDFNMLIRSEFDLYSQVPLITFMNKLWLLFAMVVIVASQVAILSSFHSVNANTWVNGSTVVVISKINYANLRVEIDIMPQVLMGQSQTSLIFQNGTQIAISAEPHYKFSVTLPSTGWSSGIFGIQSEGINISNNHPIDVQFLSNSTIFQEINSRIDWTVPPYSAISVYWFIVQGNAQVTIQGYGVGL